MQTTHQHGPQDSTQPAGAALSTREDRPAAQQTEEFHGLRDNLEIIDQDDRRPCYDPDKDLEPRKECKEPPANPVSPEEAPELHLYPCQDALAKANKG